MLLIVTSCGVLAKSVNKTLRTVFGLFFLSSSLSLSEEQLSITGLSYQLCQKNDWVTTTAIPVAVKHQEENLHVL